MAMTREQFIETHMTGVLARAALLHRMGVLHGSPVMHSFCPRGQSDSAVCLAVLSSPSSSV